MVFYSKSDQIGIGLRAKFLLDAAFVKDGPRRKIQDTGGLLQGPSFCQKLNYFSVTLCERSGSVVLTLNERILHALGNPRRDVGLASKRGLNRLQQFRTSRRLQYVA